MAPNLISLPASAFTATYTTSTKTLLIRAKGRIPGFWSNPDIYRENWTGGLKFSLKGFPLGLGQRPDQDIDISHPEVITLPVARFNSSTVLVETGSGVWSIKIDYDVPVDPQKPEGDKGGLPVVVLPPIKKFLPMGEVLTINATIPAGRRSNVDIKFNEEYLKLVFASAHDNEIVWGLKWAKKPNDTDKTNPQLVEVHTYQWNGQPPPSSETVDTIQGYIVSFVLKASQ